MRLWLAMGWIVFLAISLSAQESSGVGKTRVRIEGSKFFINDEPTYAGRMWKGHSIEGLLFNSRMVQATFDDRNPETRSLWSYPDTGQWDPDRNTREFIQAMASYRDAGLLAMTLNLQGGSPQGYSKQQLWHNSAFDEDGTLRSDYKARFEAVFQEADRLGMVILLGYFYFGQDERLHDETAVLKATDQATKWLLDSGYKNVLVEINNECNVRYDHAILKPDRIHELIQRVQSTTHQGRRLYVSTSYGGGTIPQANVVRVADYVLLHGNGVKSPQAIRDMVIKTRQVAGYRDQPILFNEDDHFDFDKESNHFQSAIEAYAGWGYFDFRMAGEGYTEGFQSVPVDWKIQSDRKRGFFRMLQNITQADRP
ncbi:MAG: hypothetical protein U0905_17440 [Pirellulales bacterium]